MTDSKTTPAIQIPQQNGILVLNKPSGPTSNSCLMAIKRMGQKKIGHAGTLDPMASGVLLVLLGQATKLSGYLLAGGLKVYRGSLRLGRETDTWDAEGTVVAEKSWDGIEENDVTSAIAFWTGVREQTVPPYSAAKHKGQPLYKLARKGSPVPEKIKRIEVLQAETISVSLPAAEFRIKCSSGTYVRSLAHSLGMRLGCGAVLTELIREYSHPFGLDKSVSLDFLAAHPERLPDYVLPIEDALPGWPGIQLTEDEAARVRNGIPLPCPGVFLETLSRNGGLALLKENDRPIAIARLAADRQGNWLTVARGLWD